MKKLRLTFLLTLPLISGVLGGCSKVVDDVNPDDPLISNEYEVTKKEWNNFWQADYPYHIADNYKVTMNFDFDSGENEEMTMIINGKNCKFITPEYDAYLEILPNQKIRTYTYSGVWNTYDDTENIADYYFQYFSGYFDYNEFTFDSKTNSYKRPSAEIPYLGNAADLVIQFKNKKALNYSFVVNAPGSGSRKKYATVSGEFTYGGQTVILPEVSPVHTHTFSDLWVFDESCHWHEATCGHDVKDSYANHVDSDLNRICDVCGYYLGDINAKKVDEDTFNRILAGTGPYKFIENGTVEYTDIQNGKISSTLYLKFDGNYALQMSSSEQVDYYTEYDEQTSNYYMYVPDSNGVYKKRLVDYSGGGLLNIYLASHMLTDFNYSDFVFDSITGRYVAKNGTYHYEGNYFESFSLEFLNNKLIFASGSSRNNSNVFTFTASINYDEVEIVLPPCVTTEKVDISFWSSFGSAYSFVLTNISENLHDSLSTATKEIQIDHYSLGSFEKARMEMISAIPVCEYPDLVTGRSHDIVEYACSDILEPLDAHLSKYDSTHYSDLLHDYYGDCLNEEYNFDVDEYGNKVLSALPFSNTTELMGYNGVFVDYCASLPEYADKHLDVVPSTWQEWAEKGPYYREILDSLVQDGYCVYGRQDVEGEARDFMKTMYCGDEDHDHRNLLLDFRNVDPNLTRVISWDSTANMFITLIKQWGAEYTRLTDSQFQEDPRYRKGDIMFYSEENRPKVVECLKFFNELSKSRIIGTPVEFQVPYTSSAFENNQVMFMICTSGGLSYNTAKWTNRFRVSPLPYNADQGDNGKFVISETTSMVLTDNAYKHYDEAFEVMAKMTTGESQANWCLQTGYYPCSQSASNCPSYQRFLNEATETGLANYAQDNGVSLAEAKKQAYSIPTRVAYREGAQINQEHYMNSSEHWKKFSDPAFKGSLTIRDIVKSIFEQVFIGSPYTTVTDDFYNNILYETVNHPSIKQNPNINVVL